MIIQVRRISIIGRVGTTSNFTIPFCRVRVAVLGRGVVRLRIKLLILLAIAEQFSNPNLKPYSNSIIPPSFHVNSWRMMVYKLINRSYIIIIIIFLFTLQMGKEYSFELLRGLNGCRGKPRDWKWSKTIERILKMEKSKWNKKSYCEDDGSGRWGR